MTHRLSSERCLNYYDTLSPEQLQENNSTSPGTGGICPEFLSETNKNKGEDSNGKKSDTLTIVLITIGVTVGVAFAAMLVIFFLQANTASATNTVLHTTAPVKKERMSWYEDNPIQAFTLPRTDSTGSASSRIHRGSGLNPFTSRSESYVELSDVTMPSEVAEVGQSLDGTADEAY
jgi:hypothetical protein